MLAFGKRRPDVAAIDRVREWVRARFRLDEDATVMVSQVVCGVPGCPPLETVIAFWTDLGRHQFKVFKPAGEVGEDDLPPTWMKNALIAADDGNWECC
jgi:nitrate reductase delta subunit